ncbi:MAG TPA: hemolysin III family protein [Dehalococcoidia bacterium]|nr:hemolysin III family protein [Dehalococcoidia bacterium]
MDRLETALFGESTRPLFRGWLHLWAAVAAIASLPFLISISDSPKANVSAVVFGVSVILVYGTSAAYHRGSWSPFLSRIISAMDHSMVLVLIGGTYTPFCLVVLNARWGISLLITVWLLVAGGIFMNLARPKTSRWLRFAFYATLGWLALVPAAELAVRSSAAPLIFLTAGGVSYTLGGIIYALRRPDPWPKVFGYIETFHLFIVAGSILHYAAVASSL